MIYGKIGSGLGNALFVIAAGATLASRCGTRFQAVFEERDHFEHHPNGLEAYFEQFKENIFRNISIRKNLPDAYRLYREASFRYSPLPLQDGLLLKGLFFSYKYFDDCLVRKLFEIDAGTRRQIADRLGDSLSEATCINVRRGDYLGFPLYLPVCSAGYYRNAIKKIGKDSLFIVTSNDIAWCKKKLKGKNFIFVDNTTPVVDFYIQTLCRNNIISNGTFSWWGAYLNASPDKIVIVPKPWFGKGMNHDTRDFIPEEWIAVDSPPELSVRMANLKHMFAEMVRRNGVLKKIYGIVKNLLR
jgi:hypothetical protein